MNAKTEKRLGLTAAFLLTAAMFIAPNPIQQQQKTTVFSSAENAVSVALQPIIMAQNNLTYKAIH